MKIFPEKYNHTEIESKWQTYWETHATYKWDESKTREENFVIDTPPPTVSGLLHMGHISSYTQADFIARYQRMRGKNVFYPIGFDNNGLPTERLVEKVKKIRARDLHREEFKKLCLEVIDGCEKEFKEVFDHIALSVDWSQKYQTISPLAMTISQMSFLDLHKHGHIYRSLEPTIWDPVDRTALAQTDLEDIELSSVMNEVQFTTQDGDNINIATTRPELLPACVAVLFNPSDNRYKHLAGKFAVTPMFGTQVPIIADENVELDKGTGLVMCCTFGDATDIEWWKKYKLPTRIVLDHAGKLNLAEVSCDQELKSKLDGQKVKEAREIMITLLREQNKLLLQTEVRRMVKCAERSKAPVEILVSMQWFIRVLDKKDELIKKAHECAWHPEFMRHRIENWINGLKWDWCISRQRYFGVPFPVWYSKRQGEEGKVLLASKQQLPVDPTLSLPEGYSRDEVEADLDIMDTWATSSISPQINSQAINEEFAIDLDRHRKLFPADLRPQSHEIIRTWAFGTIVKSMLHEDTIPWKNLMISGWVLASDKTKMSKSKGNVVTPINLINEKGADVVRYWASTSKLGTDVAYSEDMFKIGQKLITKLWNAAKFVSLHLKNLTPTLSSRLAADLSPSTPPLRGFAQDRSASVRDDNAVKNSIDLWLLSKLHKAAFRATQELEKFEYCTARSLLEEFFWKDFCDNYLELIKLRIYDEAGQDAQGKQSAIVTTAFALETLLKLFAPFLPFITEELYSIIYDGRGSIHSSNTWPDYKTIPFNHEDHELGQHVIEILESIRKFKAERQLSVKAQLSMINIISGKPEEYFRDIVKDLKAVTNTEKLLFNQTTTANEFTTLLKTINFEILVSHVQV